MPQDIRPRRSFVPNAVPVPEADIPAAGSLLINWSDGKLYTKNQSGDLITIVAGGGGGGGGSFFDPQPVTQKTASYSLTAGDAGSLIAFSASTGTLTITVPSTATQSFVVGSHIDIARTGAAAVSVTPGSGVSVGATPGLSLRAQYSAGTLVCVAPDSWLFVGDLA